MLIGIKQNKAMKIKTLFFVLLMAITTNGHSQNFGTFSGTLRVGGGSYGPVFAIVTPVTVGLLQAFNVTSFNANDWSSEQHTFWRFFNIGGDLLMPNWSMSASNANIELHRPLEDYQTNFLNKSLKQYTNYIGYYFNWKSQFSRFGCYFGMDYEWRSFLIMYPYPNVSYNKTQSIVPAVGVRFRLLDPMKEIEGFPFNIVLEGGGAFVIHTKYENNCGNGLGVINNGFSGYGLDALNNGFRSMLGVAITTNRFGSIHLRWTKDLFNLFDNDYKATDGFLYNNEITTRCSYLSIGWAIFI